MSNVSNIPTNASIADHLSTLVDQANLLTHELSGATPKEAFKVIKSVIDNSEVCFGVWSDAARAGGAGFHVIKGAARLKEIVATGASQELKVAAIPCTCAEQAIAAQRTLGDTLN